jgi:hypothetical protein
MKTLRRILTGTALAVMSAGLAGAVTTGYTAITPTGAGTGGSGFDNTDFSYSLTLPKFDAAGLNATLTGVKLYYFGEIHTTALGFSNGGATAQTFDLDVNSRINFGGLINSATSINNYSQETLTQLSVNNITLGGAGSGTVACAPATPNASCNSVNYAPPTIVNDNSGFGSISGVGDGVRTVTGVQKNVLAADLANYIGTGQTFTLSSATKSQLSFSGGGGVINLNQSTKARFEVEVDYTYTVNSATPEPTTMILFGSALVGLGFMRRKK